jgi:hypothetical protein
MKADVDTVKALLNYCSLSGRFLWRNRPRSCFKTDAEWRRWNVRYSGTLAGTINSKGYLAIHIGRQRHLAHQLAWAISCGEYPDGDIDHINGDKLDNRIENLRCVTRAENSRNSKSRSNASGAMGVTKHHNKWRATIYNDGKQVHLGLFASIDEAKAARKDAERKFGYHPNHGRAA